MPNSKSELMEPTYTVTLKLTEEQLALVTALLGKDAASIEEVSQKLVQQLREEAHKKQMASMPYKEFLIERQQDAYVIHRATIKARTRDEAFNILNGSGNQDSFFNLEEEGDVVIFDDLRYECCEADQVH